MRSQVKIPFAANAPEQTLFFDHGVADPAPNSKKYPPEENGSRLLPQGVIMEPPPGLGERGRRMWTESLAIWSLTPAHLVLLEEACRIADRLDLLNTMLGSLSGDVNPDVAQFSDISGLLSESRQQSSALKLLLAEVRQGQRGSGPAEADPAGGVGVADLTARIAKRRGQAEG
ncbi:hypothetical protein ACIP4S_13095 [Streptomyces chartreusis]|uniref:hypothetical protein n=1 Tax=Streptomyces chartreusis TaxID=1969 RepID=UPI00381ACC4E